jgi:hypothetical protein
MLHPSAEIEVSSPHAGDVGKVLGEPASFASSRFVNWFIDFDERVLKPGLIFKYDKIRSILDVANQEKLKEQADL